MQTISITPATYRAAGFLYLAIILLGLTSELSVRAPLQGLDPALMAERIVEAEMSFRLSMAADMVMVVADVALAASLFVILAPVSAPLAAAAAVFRLVQATTIAGNLIHQEAALSWALEGEPVLAATAMHLHGVGYDHGLIFFGVNTLIVGWLLTRHEGFAHWLGGLMGLAGVTYLTGSTLRILAPELARAFQPAYLIAIIAEVAFMIALLRHGWPRSRTVEA